MGHPERIVRRRTSIAEVKQRVLAILQSPPGRHWSGPDLAALLQTHPRTIRTAIRSLRRDDGHWNILSRAGDDPVTDGYWISLDPAEIARNRDYHARYGKDHMFRTGHMQPARSVAVAQASGQAIFN